MEEKARDYKMRIDAKWRKNERNRNKLIRKIKEYELFDEWYKERVEREILEAFSKKEKEEKGKDYNDIVKLIEDADRKYEILNELRGDLEMKEKEKAQNEKKIRESRFDWVDRTAMDIQKRKLNELKEKREEMGLKIEEIKKEIADKEEEIREMEEMYWKKLDAEPEDESVEDWGLLLKKSKIEEPTTSKEYYDWIIQDLWNKDKIRWEILKILEEWTWIWEGLSENIKKKLSETFFAYYDERQWSLRMKTGRWIKNLKRKNEEDGEEEQEEEKIEERIDMPREKRENLILQWYEKKLNRDELLKALDEDVIMDKESKKKLKEEIMKEFYENYEREKKWYQLVDIEYREIKRAKRQLKSKAEELMMEREKTKWEMKEINEEMWEIAEKAMKLENGSWRNKRKLGRTKARWDELDKRKRQIERKIWKLETEEEELQLLLKNKEEKYWGEISWSISKPEKIERKMSKEQEESELKEQQVTLKWYKKRYEQMIKDREEYNKKLLWVIREMDLGISEEKKKEVLEKMEADMKKEVEELKEWNETKKIADETEKWLKDNWKTEMENLIWMRKEIEESRKQVKKLELKEKWKNINEVLQIRDEECELMWRVFSLEDKYEQLKSYLQDKLEKYEGTYISDESFVVETFEEREWRILKWIFAKECPYRWIDIKKVKKEKMLKGYKQKYEQMIKDREEYNKKLLWVIREMDLGISEEKKKEVLENMEAYMKKEIEDLRKWDTTMKEAEEIEKWLVENWKLKMEKLIEMKKEIEEKEWQIKELKSKLEGAWRDYSIIDKSVSKTGTQTWDDIIQTLNEKFETDRELLSKLERILSQIREQRDLIKSELNNKLKKYNWIHILEENLVVETFFEMESRKEKEKEEKKMISKTKKMLDSYREKWEQYINISSKLKQKIIKSSENIPVKIEDNRDWSRMITIQLSWKIYQILLVQSTYSNSDDEYNDDEWGFDEEWMKWDNIDWWENGKLKRYVKKKMKDWLYVPTRGELKDMLKELWRQAGFDRIDAEIAMLMYLTGMDGDYFISMSGDPRCREIIECDFGLRNGFHFDNKDYVRAPLLLYCVKS